MDQKRREQLRIKNAEYQARKNNRMSAQERAKREQDRLNKAELKKREEAGEWVCKAPVKPVDVVPPAKLDLSIVDSMDGNVTWTKQRIDWSEE
jgi:hypothetical protein